MILKFFILLLFLFILFLCFFILSKQKISFYEYYTPKTLYDGFYITNTVSTKVICIEVNGINGLKVSMKDTVETVNYNSFLKFNLNRGSDIVDIQCANGNYWYFNYSSKYGTEENCSIIGDNNESEGEMIDLSSISSSQIYQNALIFENGTMITFDITGTHMIISTVPTNNFQSAQCIFALGSYDYDNLLGNTMVLLNNTINPPSNYFFYNGSCGINNYGGNTKNGINPFETIAIYIQNNKTQSIIPFSNGCFIDGSISSFPSGEKSLRFIGSNGIINFNLNNTYDMFQIWNPSLSNYFYYNYSNQVGIIDTKYSIYSSGNNYWNMYSLNLLPYTLNIPFKDINYSYVDQILIYNPNSNNNLAILIQVDTNTYFNKMIVPDGANNYAITISSILYENGTITPNPNATSRIFFNINSVSSNSIDFNFGNTYLTFNDNNTFDLNKTVNKEQFSLFPNISTLAIRNKPTNLLVFENTMNFEGGTQIGIDANGNCLWRGSTAQIEFNIAKLNNGYSFCMYGINSDGSFNYNVNNFFSTSKNISNPIGQNISSGVEYTLPNSCGYEKTGNTLENNTIQSGGNVSCKNVPNINPENNLLYRIINGKYSIIEPNFTPSTLVSNNNSSNIINDISNITLLSNITFSNGIQFKVNKNSLILEGFSGNFISYLNNKNGNIIEIEPMNKKGLYFPYSFNS